MPIKNLLFDLGGVIMDIRRQRCVEAFERLGLKNAADYFGEFSQKGVFMQLERGDISVEEFHEAFRPNLPAGTTDTQIDSAFCQFLTGIPAYRLGQLLELRKHFKVYLLSNTNLVMWDSTIADEFRKEGLTREDYFDGIVTSFRANALKPEAKIFKYAEDTLHIRPEETLFFDDSQTNLDAAAALGFHTALVPPGAEFMDIIKEKGLIK